MIETLYAVTFVLMMCFIYKNGRKHAEFLKRLNTSHYNLKFPGGISIKVLPFLDRPKHKFSSSVFQTFIFIELMLNFQAINCS